MGKTRTAVVPDSEGVHPVKLEVDATLRRAARLYGPNLAAEVGLATTSQSAAPEEPAKVRLIDRVFQVFDQAIIELETEVGMTSAQALREGDELGRAVHALRAAHERSMRLSEAALQELSKLAIPSADTLMVLPVVLVCIVAAMTISDRIEAGGLSLADVQEMQANVDKLVRSQEEIFSAIGESAAVDDDGIRLMDGKR